MRGSVDPLDVKKDKVQQRAFRLFEQFAMSICRVLKPMIEEIEAQQHSQWRDETKNRWEVGATLAKHLSQEIFFGSGSFKPHNAQDHAELTDEEKGVFLREAEGIIASLSDLPLIGTAHDLLQVLEYLITADPMRVFIKVGHIVEVNRRSGYQYEQLAIQLMIKVVQRYLAEYRYIFREDVRTREMLITILDIFVSAGWPEAIQLTYSVKDIDR